MTQALAAARLAPHRLELEITEAVLLQDDEATVTMLHQLRALGVRVAMDDFGTGYSSLSYLRSFPFDKIKIDRSFVKDIERKRDSAAIIRAIAGLGASLGIETTAEGDRDRRSSSSIVRRAGCTEMQGYLASPPRPAADVPGLIARFTARSWRRNQPRNIPRPLEARGKGPRIRASQRQPRQQRHRTRRRTFGFDRIDRAGHGPACRDRVEIDNRRIHELHHRAVVTMLLRRLGQRRQLRLIARQHPHHAVAIVRVHGEQPPPRNETAEDQPMHRESLG